MNPLSAIQIIHKIEKKTKQTNKLSLIGDQLKKQTKSSRLWRQENKTKTKQTKKLT